MKREEITTDVHGSSGSGRSYQLTMYNSIGQISLLAGFVDIIATENGLDQSLALKMNLAIEEAVTNIIMYAYPQGTTGRVILEAVVEGDVLKIILSDYGKEFDPTTVPDADISASVENRHIGGLGIHLVRTIMDSVSYKRENGKNILTMITRIKREVQIP